jgi:hypothetical protein
MNPDDLPDPDEIYRRRVETCRRLGIEPPPADRAHQLVSERSAVFAVGIEPPPALH